MQYFQKVNLIAQVELELTAPSFKGLKIRYKDIVMLDSGKFHEYFEKTTLAIVDIISEVSCLLSRF